MTALTLAEKLAVLERITKTAGWREIDRACAEVKFTRGYADHGDDITTVVCVGEAFDEALDLSGYAAISLLQGNWSWRWRLVVRLAGVILRLLDAEGNAQWLREQRAKGETLRGLVQAWIVNEGAQGEPETDKEGDRG